MQSIRSIGVVALLASGIPLGLPIGIPTETSLAVVRRGDLAAAADMSAARMAHTATALPDGRVLIAGGFVGDELAAHSAEMFTSSATASDAGRFTPLPRMRMLRHSHTATLLANGKVLIVGGYGRQNNVTAAAELFDPATNTFSDAGAMNAARAGHVAVLLRDGRVLIAGGVGPNWTFLSSAEIYDPASGRFTRTGDMTVARESHAAVRLQDGRVLVVGGHRDRRERITLYTSAEAYDPATGTFTRAGDMRTRRHKHDAILLRDGRVLVTGGSDERDDRGAYDSSELYDPRRATFVTGPRMQRTRYKHNGSALVLPNGDVLIAGGADQAELYSARTNSFALVGGTARMAGQFSAAAPLPRGGALVTGGYGSGTGPRASSWVYRP